MAVVKNTEEIKSDAKSIALKTNGKKTRNCVRKEESVNWQSAEKNGKYYWWVDNMRLFWLTIGLTILVSQNVISSIGLQVREPQTWWYESYIQWNQSEVLGDRILNQTYDIARIWVEIESPVEPKSVLIHNKPGSGIAEAMKIYWKKGYNVGLEEGTPTTIDKISYGFCGAAIVFGIITTVDLMKD